MWESLLNSIISAFTVVFQVFRMFFVWIFEHTWAFVCAIFVPIMTLFKTVISTVNEWISGTLDNIFGSSEYSYSDIFDSLDYLLQSGLGDDFLSMILKDCIYVLNLSDLVESVLVIVVPLLLSCIVYKVVKSWIPTVSGS